MNMIPLAKPASRFSADRRPITLARSVGSGASSAKSGVRLLQQSIAAPVGLRSYPPRATTSVIELSNQDATCGNPRSTWALLPLSVGTEAFWRAVQPLGHMYLLFFPSEMIVVLSE